MEVGVCVATTFVGELDSRSVSAALWVTIGGMYCVGAEEGESLGNEDGGGVAMIYVGEGVSADVVVANATAIRTNVNLNMMGNLQGFYLESADTRNQVVTMIAVHTKEWMLLPSLNDHHFHVH